MTTMTTTPTPSAALRGLLPPQAIALPTLKNGRRVIPVALGPIALDSSAGDLVTGLDLKKFAPRGGRIISLDVLITLAGTGSGADTTVSLELDGTNVTGGAAVLALATAALGHVYAATTITTGNTFTTSGGILDIEYTVGTAFTAGSMQIILYVEIYEDNTIQTGVVCRHLVSRDGRLDAWLVNLSNGGSAGTTVVRARLNGVAISESSTTLTAVSSAALSAMIPCSIDVASGDVLDLEVTTAPTAGAGLDACPLVHQLFAA